MPVSVGYHGNYLWHLPLVVSNIMGILDRPFAAVYDRAIASMETKWLGAARRQMLAGVTGNVLEVGAGTGANFQYYSAQAKVTATEFSKYFIKRAAAKITGASAEITLQEADAENLPFADDTFDAAVGTLVFCSVHDQMKALSEVRRVTKPGASLLMIEHVQADTPGKRMILNLWNPCQKVLAGGCNLNRDTRAAVVAAGFKIDEVRTLMVESGLSPHVLIRATNAK